MQGQRLFHAFFKTAEGGLVHQFQFGLSAISAFLAAS
jgi:hypothetical protein